MNLTAANIVLESFDMKQRCCLCASYEYLHYGETGCYWTDASTPEGYVWFLADSRERAIAIPTKYIFA